MASASSRRAAGMTILPAPLAPRRPAVLLQEERHRGKDVGVRGPDVAAAVAVEILRVFQVAGRHELRLPERAGPRPLQALELDVPAVHDLERAEEFRAEHRAAAWIVGQRHESRNRGTHAGEAAEVGLQPPDRDDHFRADAVMSAHTLQERAVARVHLLGRYRSVSRVRRRLRYCSRSRVNSACVRSRSRICSTGSIPVNAASSTSARIPRSSASVRSSASHCSNGGGAATGATAGTPCAKTGPRHPSHAATIHRATKPRAIARL